MEIAIFVLKWVTNGQAVGKMPIASEVLNALAISPIMSAQVKSMATIKLHSTF